MTELKKRTWVYLMQPDGFDISPCECGNRATQWSEYENHLWCANCKSDFVPEHWGILDGPVPVGLCKLMGLTFDRLNLITGEIEPFLTKPAEVPTSTPESFVERGASQ